MKKCSMGLPAQYESAISQPIRTSSAAIETFSNSWTLLVSNADGELRFVALSVQ